MDIQEKESTEIQKEIQVYENIISPITRGHIDVCRCQEIRLKQLKEEYFRREEKELRDEDLYKDTTVRESRLRRSIEMAKLHLVRECQENNVRCPVEKDIINRDIALFKQRYDLTDPRAHMIIENVLSLKLSAHRLALHSTHNEPIQTYMDKEGNEIFRLNPAEKAKMEYNNSMIQAIKELNLIFEGQKSIHGFLDLTKVLKASEVWGTDREIVGEFKKIE
jgi:hypothetical protein